MAVEIQDTRNKSKETSGRGRGSGSGSNLENIKHKTLNVKQNKGQQVVGSQQSAVGKPCESLCYLCASLRDNNKELSRPPDRLPDGRDMNGQAKDSKESLRSAKST